jgi:hypothetical protein
MSNTNKDRITRLRARKSALQEKVRALQTNSNMRNKEFKVGRLNDQVLTITEKIMELEGKKK